jgi:ABC-type glycerol-3-phosphate transport system substrate-binding protein
VAVALLAVAAVGCGADEAAPRLDGEVVEVVAVWQDAEAAAFERVLDAFEAETGATVRYTSTEGEDIAAMVDRRLTAGDPPDVAVLPQPGLLATYADRGAVLPVDELVGDAVRAHYAPEWRRLATVDGRLYGVWFKAANKSLVWYSIGAFERAGVIPPPDLDGLSEVARALTAAGTPAFSVPNDPAEAWTLTDLFENLYLRVAGPTRYDALARHAIAWTDPSVEATLTTFASLLAAPQRAPLPPDADFPDSVAAVFSPTPAAAMVAEGDFVPGVVADRSRIEVGVDVDVFAFPEAHRLDRFVVGGGDAAVLMRPSEGGRALLRFLATPAAAEVWARLGGFLSPNEDVDLAAYPDATTRRVARALLDAGGGGFRFDLSDLQPAAFGGTTGAGMWAVLEDLVAGVIDVPTATQLLEKAASAAWAATGR